MTLYRLVPALAALAFATTAVSPLKAHAAPPAAAAGALKAIPGAVPVTAAMQPKIDELLAAIANNKVDVAAMTKAENETAWLALAGGAYPPGVVARSIAALRWGHRTAGSKGGDRPEADARLKNVLLGRMKEAEPKVRTEAFISTGLFLGAEIDADVIKRISEIFKDKGSSPALRALAVGQLTEANATKVIDNAQWLDLVLTAMSDANPYVRLAGLNSLPQWFWNAEAKADAAGLTRVQKALEAALKQKELATRGSAAHAMVMFAARVPKHQAALKPTLTAMIADKQPEVRAAGAAAVADVPMPELLAKLEPLLDDKGAGAVELTGGTDIQGNPWTFNALYSGTPNFPNQVRDFALGSVKTRAVDANAALACDDSAPADDAAAEKQLQACIALARAFLKNPPAPPAEP